MSSHQELFQKYRSDRTQAAFEALSRACRPLVASVCWRYLRRPEDVDDAIQETFLKLVGNIDAITGDLVAWLTATAHAVSVDLIRRAVRERRRRLARGQMDSTIRDANLQRQLQREAIHLRLDQALLALDDASRELLVERFFRKTPLRVIAGRSGQSVATISRHAAAAVGNLLIVLRAMGIKSLDVQTLAEHVGDPAILPGHFSSGAGSESLRFASDWRTPLFGPMGTQAVGAAGPFWPGWSRRIRVGVLTSYLSSVTRGTPGRGVLHDVEMQVRTTEFLGHPAFQLVGMAEPATTHRGSVERVLRDYDLTGGLLDATDAEGLKTLDVILIGTVFAIDPAVAAAIAEAVRGGTGLLNEWWTGGVAVESDPNVRSLMLADSLVHPYHMEPNCTHAIHVTATVRESHSLIPGLRVGDQVEVAACGPLYRPVPSARVLIEKDHLIAPGQHSVPGLGPARAPVYVVGNLGRGRVVVAMVRMLHARFAASLAVDASQYITYTFAWLAEPRRDNG